MYLVVGLTILVLITQAAGAVPTSNLTEMLWQLWTNYAPSSAIRRLRAKRNELMEVRQERSNTSSQDEFAKWARLDREHQRLKKEYEAENEKVAATRQQLTMVVRVAKFVFSRAIMWAAQWKYRKVPVVWLPYNSLPYRVEWFLALPKAPLGSVSAVTWVFATNTMISTVLKLYKRAQLRRKAHST